MTWNDRLRDTLPLEERAAFLTDLQALVASLRGNRQPAVTDRLKRHAELALAYLDDGARKETARDALRKP